MAGPAAAYPFIEVKINTAGLTPVAQRSPGVIAIVGSTGNAGTAVANTPVQVSNLAEAATQFATITNNVPQPNALFSSLSLALKQEPRPSKIYGVKISGTDIAAGLAALDAVDDVNFVALANVSDVGAVATGTTPATNLQALKAHVENQSAAGQKRMGVAMINPATAKSDTYVATVSAAVEPLRSSSSRMILVAARGATVDVASAAMAAIAGYEPHISIVLKRIREVTMPLASQYGPTEIRQLSEAGIIPIIDPTLIVGPSLHFAEGRAFTSDASLLYIDIVRTLDDIEFRIKAGLIGSIGDARITRSGLLDIRTTIDGILGGLVRRSVIDAYAIDIPVLAILSLPEASWSAADRQAVADARANRSVAVGLSITYGPAVHRLVITLTPKF